MIQPGTYKIIRVDGAEEVMVGKPTIRAIEAAISADCCDTVILTRNGREPEIVMLVDDTGMIDEKPVNEKATALYLGVCKPGTTHQIHGDVAIAWDGDFA